MSIGARVGLGRRRAWILSLTLQRSSWLLPVHGLSAYGTSGGEGGDWGGEGGEGGGSEGGDGGDGGDGGIKGGGAAGGVRRQHRES